MIEETAQHRGHLDLLRDALGLEADRRTDLGTDATGPAQAV
jgi:hypothetical protein